MNVTVTPEVEDEIRHWLETGQYSDVDAVLRDALQLLKQRDQVHRLRVSVAEADDQIDRGLGIPFTPERFEQIRLNARTKFEAGHRPPSH